VKPSRRRCVSPPVKRPSCSYQWRQKGLMLTALVLLGLLIYSNTLQGPFIFDDSYIANQSKLRITHLTLKEILRAGFESRIKTRPVANISFGLNYYLHGYGVRGYHIVNILIHIMNAILLFLFIQTTLRTPVLARQNFHVWMPFSAVLLWLVNPLHTQSVTYIYQRMNSLAVMFYLLAFWLYVKARLADSRYRKIGFFSGCVVSGVLALGTKEIAASLPFFILLYEQFLFQDLRFKRSQRFFLIIACLGLFLAIITVAYVGSDPWVRILKTYVKRDFTINQRLLTEFRVVLFYIGLLLYPHPSRLNLDHDFPLSFSLINPLTTLPAIGVVFGLFGAAVYLARKERLIAFSILWFLGNLVIESSVVGLEIIFEHRTYMPSMFLSLLLVILLFRYLRPQWLRIGILLSVVMLCSVWTYQRNKIWNDKVVFWSDCLKKSPHKARPYNNLGFALVQQGQLQKAMANFYQAVRIRPAYAEAHTNLGSTLENMGRISEAVKHLNKALRIKPDHVNAHYNLGVVLHRRGNLQEAIRHYRWALRGKIDHYLAHNNLGVALQSQGKLQEAFEHYHEALRIKPDYFQARRNIASILSKNQEVRFFQKK